MICINNENNECFRSASPFYPKKKEETRVK